MYQQPPPQAAAPSTPTTIDQVKSAIDECLIRSDSLRTSQAQQKQIHKQIRMAIEAAIAASRARDLAKQEYEALLGGELEDMTELKRRKVALDTAEAKLFEARQERTLVQDAAKTIELKIREADKTLNEALAAVRTLARANFRTSWSRSRMFANYAESEFNWRAGMLETLLCSLTMGDLRMNLTILETFLRGHKFTVQVQRGFLHIGTTSEDRRMLQRDERVNVPTVLPYRTGFEELRSGRLALVGA